MLQDLRRALKEPGGDFVDNKYNDFGATQRIDTLGNDKERKETRGKKTKKKMSKKVKILLWVIGLILLFAISLGGTMLYFNLTEPKDVQIPNLVGKTGEEAEKILAEYGIKLEYSDEEYNKEVEIGKIIWQDPQYKENYKVKEESTIIVAVSKGAELTTVPKVVGMTKDEAIQELKNYNLKAEIIEETSEDIKEGYITRQETAPETTIDAGETIKIYVSIGTGRIQVVVPSVVGKQLEDAQKTLTDLKLKVEIEYGEDMAKPNGQVLKQNVTSGSVLDEESTVVLTVNQIAQIKTGTVEIKLKEIAKGLGYIVEEEKDEDGEVIEKVSKVKVRVVVTSEGESKNAYGGEKGTELSADKETLTVSVSGKGTIEIALYIDENYRVQQLDLNQEKPVATFK